MISSRYSDGYPYEGTEHLLAFSRRWSALHLSNLVASDFFQLARVNAPLLEDMRITITLRTAFEREDGPRVPSSYLLRGMHVPKITLAGPELANLIPTTPFTWDHITHLTLESRKLYYSETALSCECLYRLLDGCRNLRSLACDISYVFTSHLTDLSNARSLLLPSLINLTMTPTPPSRYELEELLRHLIMPNLDQLCIAGATVSGANDASLAHLAQSSPLLSDLSLNLLDFPTTSLLPTIQLFPSLVKLRVAVAYSRAERWALPQNNAAELLGILTPSPLVPNPLPALNELITTSVWFEDRVLLDFLQKQLDYGTDLRRFQIHFACSAPDILPDVQPFADLGLDVSLMYAVNIVNSGPKYTPWEGIDP
ncbi:hypothetical protein DFH06DRAFT_1409461 [Mycena polygramma]|nr:hypothetical protein DFH06DRAFT_1409461 [Mycena polygramma]